MNGLVAPLTVNKLMIEIEFLSIESLKIYAEDSGAFSFRNIETGQLNVWSWEAPG